MISRAIRNDEEHLTANVKELLAIVWALKSSRNYLHGVKNLTIYTDHKPLTPAVPDMAKINITEHHQLLSLPFMYELSPRNLQRIGDLGGQITYSSVFSCGATAVLLLGYFALFFLIRRRNDKKTRSKLLAEILGKTEGGLNLNLGGVNPTTVNDLGPTPDARGSGNPAGEIRSLSLN